MLLKLPWPPSANRYWVLAGRRIIVSQQARAYKNAVAVYCLQHKIKPLSGYLSARVVLMPPDLRRRDCHNLVKVLFDALQGYAYQDDSQIVEVYICMDPKKRVTNGFVSLTLSQLTTNCMERFYD